jgi:hypothetical protein
LSLAVAPAIAIVSPTACPSAETTWRSFPIGADVSVVTSTGRIVRGSIDQRSTEDWLWLTAEVEGMTIGSQLDASDVIRIARAKRILLPQNAVETESIAAPAARRFASPSTRVRSLDIFAQLENWDADPAPDGLRLYLMPKGAGGELAATSGSIDATLTAYRVDLVTARTEWLGEESWASEIRSDAFRSQDVCIDLPFRTNPPPSDGNAAAVGEFRVRLNVPGEGSFDAVLHDIELCRRSFVAR